MRLSYLDYQRQMSVSGVSINHRNQPLSLTSHTPSLIIRASSQSPVYLQPPALLNTKMKKSESDKRNDDFVCSPVEMFMMWVEWSGHGS